MHFDSVQAHSGQMLMPATHFSLGAAPAGLLPDDGLLTYEFIEGLRPISPGEDLIRAGLCVFLICHVNRDLRWTREMGGEAGGRPG